MTEDFLDRLEFGLRVYHLEELRRRLFLIVGAVIGALGFFYGALAYWLLLGTPGGLGLLDWLFILVPTAGLAGVAVAVAWASTTIRLELSPSGVTLHVPGAVVSTDWEDVRAVGPAPWGVLAGESLILSRPARLRRSLPFHLVSPEVMSMAIPIAPFALPLRGSRLEADLASRLPSLFPGVGQ